MLEISNKIINNEKETIRQQLFALNRLSIDELRLKSINEGGYYTILLDDEPIGIWSLNLMDNFSEESHDIYQLEHHEEEHCFNCIDETVPICERVTNCNKIKLVSLNRAVYIVLLMTISENRKTVVKPKIYAS